MIRLLSHVLGLDNLAGMWYGFWSGFGSITIPPILTSFPIVFVLLRRHNCHHHLCWRIGRHPVEGSPYVVCRKHHPHVPDRVTTDHLNRAAGPHRRGVA
jgi:hypothetical protein